MFDEGAERLAEGQNLEALSGLQKASSLPAPRILLAYIHHLCGCCFVQMVAIPSKFDKKNKGLHHAFEYSAFCTFMNLSVFSLSPELPSDGTAVLQEGTGN